MVSNLTTLFPEVVNQYLVPILWLVTDNLLFVNQQKSEIFPHKQVPDVRVDLRTACIGRGHATD